MPVLQARFRRIKFWWHLIFAYFSRYKLRILVLIIGLVTLSYFSYKLLPSIIRKDLISIGYTGTYQIENIPSEILSLVTRPLISIDENGRPVPSLASHWSVSQDGKTYIVFLKDNQQWHDSTAVDAQNISIAITNVDITAINNKTLEFKLPNPISSFPQALNKPIFKSKTFYGTGNFRIVKIDQIDNVVRKIILHPNAPQFPKVEIKFYATEGQLLDALKIGEVKTGGITSTQNLQNWPNLEIEKKIDTSQVTTIFLNNNDEKLSSKELRQALYYAIDRQIFDGEIASGPIAPTSWAYNDTFKRYEYNIAKAKELLSKAGSEKVKITLSTTPGLDNIAQKIKESWNAIGVDVEIQEEKTLPSSFQALLALNQIPSDPDQYSLWHSTQTKTNITGYKNVKIDKLLEDARQTSDEEKRKEFYSDFQRFLQEDTPAIFLYHPYRYTVTYKNAKENLAKLHKL